MPSLLKALDRVLSRAEFPYGSNCLLFREAQFGRDALEVAEDLLAMRPMNAVNVTGGATEFLYVLCDNRIDFDPLNRVPRGDAEEIVATNVPENDQAWSISAALAVKWHRGRRHSAQPHIAAWQSELEDRLLKNVTPVQLLRTVSEIQQAFPADYSFRINTRKGWDREGTYALRHPCRASARTWLAPCTSARRTAGT